MESNYQQKEPLDGLNKEAVLDGPNGTSKHAFTGKQENNPDKDDNDEKIVGPVNTNAARRSIPE